MKIGIDARTISQENITGVGQVVYHIVRMITKTKNQCILFYDEQPSLKLEEFNPKYIKQVVLPCKNRYIWEQLYLPFALRKYKPDLYHATWNHGIPLFSPCPSVLTIHDLIPLALPGFFKSIKSRLTSYYLYKVSILLSARKASQIVTVSSASKHDIERILGESSKVKVIFNGVNAEFGSSASKDTIQDTANRFNISKKYFIYVGGLDRRKNLVGILKAFCEVLRYQKDIQLVITGTLNTLGNELQELANNQGVSDKVIFTGYVSREDLPILLSGAEALVYPSYYEGFGIPPLEAMACGTPVIASNVSSIPEVVGDAGILVDPSDHVQIAEAMKEVLVNESKKLKMIEKGLQRVQNFSWDKMGIELIQLYKTL